MWCFVFGMMLCGDPELGCQEKWHKEKVNSMEECYQKSTDMMSITKDRDSWTACYPPKSSSNPCDKEDE